MVADNLQNLYNLSWLVFFNYLIFQSRSTTFLIIFLVKYYFSSLLLAINLRGGSAFVKSDQ